MTTALITLVIFILWTFFGFIVLMFVGRSEFYKKWGDRTNIVFLCACGPMGWITLGIVLVFVDIINTLRENDNLPKK